MQGGGEHRAGPSRVASDHNRALHRLPGRARQVQSHVDSQVGVGSAPNPIGAKEAIYACHAYRFVN